MTVLPEWWVISIVATLVMIAVYSVIGYTIWAGVARGHQWRTNPLAVSMGLIFVACTVGHGTHIVHALLPSLGASVTLGEAARAAFDDPRLALWHVFAAVIAVWYLTLRNRLKIVWQGAALFEDMKQREARALDIHDSVVQGLAEAKLAIELGKRDEGLAHVNATLEDAKRIITDILGEEGSVVELGAGDLRRQQAGG